MMQNRIVPAGLPDERRDGGGTRRAGEGDGAVLNREGRNRIRVLGITGGVGAGKSTVLAYLEQKYHAHLIVCDEAAKQLQQPLGACYGPMLELFGPGVLRPDGQFDRGKVAALIFAQKELRERLNQIVHPAVKQYVREEIRRLAKKESPPLIVIEAALLLEEHYEQICDEIWYVYAPETVRRRRLQESRGYSEEKIVQVMRSQLSEEAFRKRCQFVVDNGGDLVENTYEQIDEGLRKHGFL